MMRLRRSRPRWSVPSTYCHSPSCPQAGGSKRSSKRSRIGLCGATCGEKSAVMMSVSKMNRLTPTSGEMRLLIPNPRVKHRIQQIDDEINAHEKYGGAEHRCLHNRIVAVIDPLNGQAADAWPGEHRFGDHRPAQQRAELQAHDRHHRDRCVFQGMPPDDPPFAETFGT